MQWGGEDSNLRRHQPTDLQSVPFDRSGTSPRTCALDNIRMCKIRYEQEPMRGVEPPTCRLQIGCSAIELHRRRGHPHATAGRRRERSRIIKMIPCVNGELLSSFGYCVNLVQDRPNQRSAGRATSQHCKFPSVAVVPSGSAKRAAERCSQA